MHHYSLALIGFGGVNRALAEIVADQSDELTQSLGYTLSVVAITDLELGTWIDASGIDVQRALSIPRGGSFAGEAGGSGEMDNSRAITESSADIVVEATFTNPVDGEPASSHVQWALESGKHVVTTNKGPVARHGARLRALASDHGVRFEYEGTVMSGTPVLRFAENMLTGNTIRGFEGILNGTSNYVLERMAVGLSLDDAIREAQEIGYAEADPTADIGGSDVRLKVVILANEVLGADITVEDVMTSGIESVTRESIQKEAACGRTLKLVGRAARSDDGTIEASVSTVALPQHHPLAGISGATNAVTFDTSLLGNVTVSGPGAGRVETAYALLSDITAIHRHEITQGAS